MPLPTYSDDDLAKLSVAQLVDVLIRDEDRAPRNVIDECARRGEPMLEALKSKFSSERAWRRDVSLGLWWLRLHAVMIFGLMPTEGAASALVDWMRRMLEGGLDDLQDCLAGYWPVLFRNKPDTVRRELRALSDDRALDWYTRATAVDAIVLIGARRGAESLEADLAWLALIAADGEEDWDFRFAVGSTLIEFPRPRYRSILEALALADAYGEIDAADCTMSLDITSVEDAYARGEDEPQWLRWEDPWAFYNASAIAARQLRWREKPPDRGDEAEAGRTANDPGPGSRSPQAKKRRARLH